MSSGPDPLDALRDAWRELPEAPAWRDLEREDEATRRTVAWIAAAWRELAPPPLPSALPRPRRARVRRGPRRLGLGLAAAAAALALVFLVRHAPAPPAHETLAEPLAALAPVEVTRNRAGHVELRSGPVRLVVLPSSAPQRPEPRTRSRQPRSRQR